ncbi:CobW family GTP-binding protein [Sulfuriferula nivalis]|uniref:ATP-binding protein n=1 Tax=Sulfuriferula nivalis TaxID=2675298 RepID=A0A809RZW0_9PROT|nr:GTP-binding protein [Sulfuriferula nivalis]BBO99767.1 ATP-binding protein [Sulfuriferula nivalis]
MSITQEAHRIPVVLLTGFLGSGKTTLLNHLIAQLPHTAIIMNEFGEIGLDHQLLQKTDGPLALLQGGCVCCTVAGSLSPTLRNLFMAAKSGDIPQFERVIIETTGIADPAPILETLLNDRWVAARFALNSVVTTVDAVLGEQQLDSYFEAVKQVAVADRLLITKADLAGEKQVALIRERLVTLNPAAPILMADHGQIEPELILNAGIFNPATKQPEVAQWLNEARYRPVVAGKLGGKAAMKSDAVHDDRIRSFSLTYDEPLEWDALNAALRMLLTHRAKWVLRMKAIVNLQGKEHPTVLHAVGHVFSPPVDLPEWPDADHRSRFVFIVADLDAEAVAQMLEDFKSAYQANK